MLGGVMPPCYFWCIIMAIAVYRKGNSHVVDGTPCEIVLCLDVEEMNYYLKNGCVKNEKELLVSKKEESKEVTHQKHNGNKNFHR